MPSMRKGMQLILRASLNDMYIRFQQQPPTADDKQAFEEMFEVYEKLAEEKPEGDLAWKIHQRWCV